MIQFGSVSLVLLGVSVFGSPLENSRIQRVFNGKLVTYTMHAAKIDQVVRQN